MNKCYGNYLRYEFDVDGKTIPKCDAPRDGYSGKGRKICPHYGGKCPATVGFEEDLNGEN